MKQISSSAIARSLLGRCRAIACRATRQVVVKRESGSHQAGLTSQLPRTIGLAALAIFLGWEVTSRSIVAYLADSAPETAARLRPGEPTALLNLAERELNRPIAPEPAAPEGSASSRDATFDRRIRTWAESALLSDPLNARGLRILGQVASQEKDVESALKFMRASARISTHESLAVYWAMQDSVEKHNYEEALNYADALLRTRPSLMSYVTPALTKMSENKESNYALKRLLYSNPPWRTPFLGALIESVSDIRIPLDVLLFLRDSPNPASNSEVRLYLDFLVKYNVYDLAYYAWLQLLPPDELANVGLLFNGSFEFVPSGLPFDWAITYGPGVFVDVVPIAEKPNEHALYVEFEHGRVDYHSIMQTIMLPPGHYHFHGKYKGDLVGPRGLKWRINCLNAGDQMVGESEMVIGTMPSWVDVGFRFAVPEEDCHAQHVRLDLDARMASERIVTGSVWFDELQIVRSNDAGSK